MPEMTRRALYDLVWATPMKTLAGEYGLSDVGLKKVCAKAAVPVPERGYWAKRAAGRPARQPPLPPRAPSASDRVGWGAPVNDWAWPRNPERELAKPALELPVFEEPMEDVESRIRKQVGKVRPIKDLDCPHPEIRRLLDKDEKRRAKIAEWPSNATFDPLLFESAFERRRLKLLNSLIFGLAQALCKVSVGGKAGRDIHVGVGEQHVRITLDHPDAKPDRHGEATARAGGVDRLRLVAPGNDLNSAAQKIWMDDNDGKLEQKLTEIVVHLILAGEALYREGANWAYENNVKHRREMQVELEKQRAAAIEAERVRQAEHRKRQREALFTMARDRRQAADLRALVADVVVAAPLDSAELDAWTIWARGVANSHDPLLRPSFSSDLEMMRAPLPPA